MLAGMGLGRTRVKVCGITRAEDALAAVRLGADALGFNFWPGSARALAAEAAAAIVAGLPAFVAKVGLFVDAAPDEVRQRCGALPLDLLQFHGDEAPSYCGAFGKPFIKAIRGGSREAIAATAARYPQAAALLVDGFDDEGFGGRGKAFDWTQLPELPRPLVLAGGLHAGNVADAIRQTRPYAVDVASGVEAAKGQKDPARLRDFFAAVRAGDGQ